MSDVWSLFPELIGPIAAAFVLGSLLAWLLVAVLLPRFPTGADKPSEPGGRR